MEGELRNRLLLEREKKQSTDSGNVRYGKEVKPQTAVSGFVDKWMHVWPVTVKCELFLHLEDQTVCHN